VIDYLKELEDRGLDITISTSNKGVDYAMTLCPFHDDNSPSFSVGLSNGKFRCFGCEERGDFADLISTLDDIPLKDARKKLKQQDGLAGLYASIARSLVEEDKPTYFKLTSFHKIYPAIKKGSAGYRYLTGTKRKFSWESIKRFDIRWGADTKYYNRVVYPIRTVAGKLVSYVGVAIEKDPICKTMKATSPGDNFYGLYELLKIINPVGKLEYLVIVEGESDAIYLQQFQVPAIANMGTSLITQKQLTLLKKYTKRIVLSYDGDLAGRRAVYGNEKKRIGDYNVLQKSIPTLSIDLPDDLDPNKMTKKQVIKYYKEFLWPQC